MKDAVKKAGLKGKVRVQETGCLDQCEHAAVAVVYPEAVWYGFLKLEDVGEMVQQHLVEGKPVERLRLPESCINTAQCAHRPART
ncbi:MAG: (2Fe-2S) ferredoxin domain-containing protein [Acidobacteriaceae bacterium]|nr:(2Fe-2S) ferredoxin domain-containing protein [Acidobacteriaceae bacterium]